MVREDIDEVLEEFEEKPKVEKPVEVEPKYEFELFLSTDGKHTVHIKADTKEGRKKALAVATETYDYIKTRYGTKQGQAVREYSKNGESKPDQSTCSHENIKFAQSKTEKNPGRWFKSCKDCGKFLGWKS